MDKFRAIRLFVRLADLGSFTRLAEEMNLSKSMVSKELSRLEDSIGARLIQRSTRNLQLTQAGVDYLERCRDILERLDDADALVQQRTDAPRGKLKINAPMALGITDLSRMFAEFMQAYPEIELDIHLSDEFIDLIEHGFDLGFRAVSKPFDSNYIGRFLTRFGYRICAAPAYLAQHPSIQRVEDLKAHNCFVYSYYPSRNTWPLETGISIQGSLRVNNTLFMMEIIRQGHGIGFVPDFACMDALDKGEVVEVLPAVERPSLDLYALYPARQFAPPRLLHCVEFIERWFKANRLAHS